MSAKILEFPSGAGLAPPIAQFVRVGDAHKKLGGLVGMERFPAKRVVLQASRLDKQRQLLDLLKQSRVELVLDTQVAELASLRKFRGQERNAPWGQFCEAGPLGPDHFRADAATDVVGAIARTAVEHGFDVVLSPAHYLGDPSFAGWLNVDRESCVALRKALDREGGRHIRIDYPVIHAQTALQKNETRSVLLETFGALPVDNVWLRASGSEGTAGPESTRRFFNMLSGLHNAGFPIILDYLGGTLSLAALAFGLASGRSLGIGEMEKFDAREWHKLPRERKDDKVSFGRAVRIPIPGLGRTLSKNEVLLLSEAHGGKKLIAGQLRSVEELLSNAREYQLGQMAQEIGAMEAIPQLRRDEWFLTSSIAPMVRKSRDFARLKPPKARAEELKIDPDKLMSRLAEHAQKAEKSQIALEAFRDSRSDDAPRARPANPPRVNNEPRKREQG